MAKPMKIAEDHPRRSKPLETQESDFDDDEKKVVKETAFIPPALKKTLCSSTFLQITRIVADPLEWRK